MQIRLNILTKSMPLVICLRIVHFTLLLCFLTNIALGQHSELGHKIKTPWFSKTIPLIKTREHGVSFQPFTMGNLGMLSGVNSVNVLELNYGNKFNLIKHDFKANKNKVYSYEINKFNRFKNYCYDENFFYTLSKNNVDGRLQYYLDVIDLNTFEHTIKNKLIIKYMSRRDQEIALFKKTSSSLVLVLENRIIENSSKNIELFLLSAKSGVEKYYEEKIPVSFGKLVLGGFYDWGESYSIVYNDRTVIKNDTGFFNYCYGIKFDAGSISKRKFVSPLDHFVISSVFLDSVTLVALTTSTPFKLSHPDAISIINQDAEQSTVIELPFVFRNKIASFENGSFSSELNYKFTQFKNQLYLIETYKSYYESNGTISYKFGPGILLKLNEDYEIDWFLDLENLKIDILWPDQNLACIQTNEEDLYLFYSTHAGIELQKVEMADGSLVNKPLNLEKKWLRSNLRGFQFNAESNSAIILLIKNFSTKPFYLSF
jgi:hypothetical protein